MCHLDSRKLITEKLMLLNCGVGCRLLRVSWTARRSVLGVHWKDWCWSWNSNTMTTWCEELTHWKRTWCWEGLGAGGEGDDRWDGWMASPTRWIWVWVNSGSWWWTRRLGCCDSWGRKELDTTERLIELMILKKEWPRNPSTQDPGCENHNGAVYLGEENFIVWMLQHTYLPNLWVIYNLVFKFFFSFLELYFFLIFENSASNSRKDILSYILLLSCVIVKTSNLTDFNSNVLLTEE